MRQHSLVHLAVIIAAVTPDTRGSSMTFRNDDVNAAAKSTANDAWNSIDTTHCWTRCKPT